MKRLVMQSIGPPGDQYDQWMLLTRDPHIEYAHACGADYWFFDGLVAGATHPKWNRLAMFLDAFADGYDEVLWLDADTLVVRPEENIFVLTDPDAAMQMTRQFGDSLRSEWREPGWDVYNDGVLLARPDARPCFEYAWENRDERPRDYHRDFAEMNWINDYVFEHPESVVHLPERWNAWQDPRPDDTVILAWHASMATGRRGLRAAFKELWQARVERYGPVV